MDEEFPTFKPTFKLFVNGKLKATFHDRSKLYDEIRDWYGFYANDLVDVEWKCSNPFDILKDECYVTIKKNMK